MSLRALLPYSFIGGVAIVLPVYGWLGEEALMGPGTLALYLVAAALYWRAGKPFFFAFYFNYLVYWICFGNVNFLLYRNIWSGFYGDIARANGLYAVFLVVFSAAGLLWNGRLQGERPTPVTRVDVSYPVFLTVGAVLIALFCALYLPAIGWTGIYGGRITNENRFLIEMPSITNRLVFVFHVLGLLLVHRLAVTGRGFAITVAFFTGTFLILTAGGARWPFFQVLVSVFFLLALTDNLGIVRRYRALAIAAAVVFIVFQPLLAILRSGGAAGDLGGVFGSLASFGASWGGEFRDGAAALERLGHDQVQEISRHYLETLFVPVVPRQLTELAGIDKDHVLTLAGAFVMQEEYGIEFGAIRIGGIIEAYFWAGMVGVLLVAAANYAASHAIDWYAYRAGKSMTGAMLIAFGGATVLYFIASQSSALLAPPFAFLSLYVALKVAQWALGHPNTPLTRVAGTLESRAARQSEA